MLLNIKITLFVPESNIRTNNSAKLELGYVKEVFGGTKLIFAS